MSSNAAPGPKPLTPLPPYRAGGGLTAPPKPVTGPWLKIEVPDTGPLVATPASVTQSWRGFWHALGSTLPFYVNHSRAARRALRASGTRHG